MELAVGGLQQQKLQDWFGGRRQKDNQRKNTGEKTTAGSGTSILQTKTGNIWSENQNHDSRGFISGAPCQTHQLITLSVLYFLQWNRQQHLSLCEINHIKCVFRQALICFAVSSVPVCKQLLLSSLLRSRRSQSVWSRSQSHPLITPLFAQVLNPSLGAINRSIFSFQTHAGLYWGSCVGWTEDFSDWSVFVS